MVNRKGWDRRNEFNQEEMIIKMAGTPAETRTEKFPNTF
jgi:hypothetical protein